MSVDGCKTSSKGSSVKTKQILEKMTLEAKETLSENDITVRIEPYNDFYTDTMMEGDGNYTDIFKNLDEWEICNTAPQYDVDTNNPQMVGHGDNQKMYKLEAKKNTTYSIPKSGDSKNGATWCTWNIVMVK